ncbi:hypothetical protein [Novosphingobium sp. Rr 2-17]|uniref:hypothetical protein n=1 Tax=Novosphingobium sp. Rr 2-17 TaxID=555793 RepID=UPI0002FDBC85
MSAVIALAPATAMAETPRQFLTAAAFEAPNKARALALVGQAIGAADRILATDPGDREAMLQRAVAIGYRGKLTGSGKDVRASLPVFERLVAQNPRDAEAQIVLAGWHLGAVDELGGFLARTALGARSQVGETALARAVALGGNRAFYPGIAAMLQIRRDPKDLTVARKWAEMAAAAPTPTSLDALVKRSVMALLPALRANDAKKAADLAHQFLPFGRLPH